MEMSVSRRQYEFIKADADEVLFGGAAGGGKTYGQLIDSLLYALKYPKSRQLFLRRTLPELEKSAIRSALALFPRSIYSYKQQNHVGSFSNGSTIDFAYCDSENDVFKYQSAEYDVIRFDELTHFTETMYTYLLSRIRGVNGYPKQMKSSTNPGGVGHGWVKARFIDPAPPKTKFETENGSRIFIPSKAEDNQFLMKSDPDYLKRLMNLDENNRRALLYGDWDIFEGQYFSEFNRAIHVKPARVPQKGSRIYRTLDYGLDMLACYWIEVDSSYNAYVFRELYQSNLIISQAAREILNNSPEKIYCTLAPPDLWNRRQESGKSVAEWFNESGLPLTKSTNKRVEGWLAVKEWLKTEKNEFGEAASRLTISEDCRNLIRTLPALCRDKLNPNDASDFPHELTHAPDALRYFCAFHSYPPRVVADKADFSPCERKSLLGKGEIPKII